MGNMCMCYPYGVMRECVPVIWVGVWLDMFIFGVMCGVCGICKPFVVVLWFTIMRYTLYAMGYVCNVLYVSA